MGIIWLYRYIYIEFDRNAFVWMCRFKCKSSWTFDEMQNCSVSLWRELLLVRINNWEPMPGQSLQRKGLSPVLDVEYGRRFHALWPLDIDALICYHWKKSKPYAESLERWRVLAESWKGDSVLGFFRLTRLSKPIVSSITGGYDGPFESLFTSIGGDMTLSLLSTNLGVAKDCLGINGVGVDMHML